MNRVPRFSLLFFLVSLVLGSATAFAQAPKVGGYYEDNTSLGFRIKMPKGWEFSPPSPGDDHLIGKYTPINNRAINISPEDRLYLHAYLIKFDRRADSTEEEDKSSKPDPSDGETESVKVYKNQEKDILKWLDGHMGGNGFRVESSKTKKIDHLEATEYKIAAQTNGSPFKVYAMLYRMQPDLDIAVIFNGPDDRGKWRKYESAASSMAKSFKRVKMKELKLSESKDSDSGLRTKKRAELEREVATTPGWTLHETDNYFIISNSDDREFMKELKMRLEAIRSVYETIYPFEAATRIKAEAQRIKREEEEEDAKESGEKRERQTTSGYTSQQKSQCSVVRVCNTSGQYHDYGGPGGSAGYWSSRAEELVIYDDQQGGGRRNTWSTLNHEAFHQYIFYLYGSLSPHSWYNEGTGDFFAGYQYKHKKFKIKRFDWRLGRVQGMLKEKRYVPLQEIVRFTQGEYYGTSDYKTTIGDHYAQGWSFIYFLRTGEGKASGWNDDWDGILDIYFERLAFTEDLDMAVDAAFEGVDWEELEKSWIAYTLD